MEQKMILETIQDDVMDFLCHFEVYPEKVLGNVGVQLREMVQSSEFLLVLSLLENYVL